jgi:hypothetical protein
VHRNLSGHERHNGCLAPAQRLSQLHDLRWLARLADNLGLEQMPQALQVADGDGFGSPGRSAVTLEATMWSFDERKMLNNPPKPKSPRKADSTEQNGEPDAER